MEAAASSPSTVPTPILLVEFDSGYMDVGRGDPVEKSEKALAKALASIKEMGQKVSATVAGLTPQPSEVEVTFGIKFDSEVGAVVAKAVMGASLEVKILWKLTEEAPDGE